MASNTSFPAAVLAIDTILTLPALYVLFKHGVRHGAVLGWAYLFIFLTLRIVSSAMQLHDPTNPSASLVASIGLSPLLLAAVGILHEARAYAIERRNSKTDLIWVIMLHLIISTAVALTASGASAMSKPDTTETDRAKDKTLVTVGMVMLLVSWVYISLVAVASFIVRPRTDSASSRSSDLKQGKWLLYAVLVAIPFLAIRIIYSLAYFSTQNQALNPATGEIGYKVGLSFVEELIISISFIVAGVATRNVGKVSQTVKVNLAQIDSRV